ncbi:Lipid phosphate phosphatase gamma [Vitis vinifera]|uniref:Lipid phosphate phosphatase gamma n=1 Tax=Vitis vinifera TaxID=29760 RepID=A0A438IPR2_VITVI|nr:Lipid phosphate phosphatase gamma [Vitis vinifera]
MPHPPLKAVTLTHVRYQRGDRFGHFLAWVSLVPVFISLGGFVSHFIFRRELQGMCFALGFTDFPIHQRMYFTLLSYKGIVLLTGNTDGLRVSLVVTGRADYVF